MDATAKPVRIPPEMIVYAEQHEIFDLVQSLVTNLLVAKPEDPLAHLIGLLRRGGAEAPRVMLLGPPGSGKTSIARRLCELIGAVHITTSSILQGDSHLTLQVQRFKDQQQEPPSELWVRAVQQRLAKADCVQQGWVLDGIPQSRREALLLQELGVAPDHAVMLEAPDSVLIDRSLGKRVDPVTGDVYHVVFRWPEDVCVQGRLEGEGVSREQSVRRLQQHHQDAPALLHTFQLQLTLINADQPHDDVLTQVLTQVQCRSRSAAPHTPRVLLLGPPASGRSLQAGLLAQKYNLVNVCSGEVLRTVAVDQSSVGELIKPYLESGDAVPDSLVLQILTQRLSRMDCTTRGWVLHGFPRSVEQARKLQECGVIPSRAFFLEMTDSTAVERVSLRALDPVTGERYHSLYKPPPSAEVLSRLRRDPRDSKEGVLARLGRYRALATALHALYPDAAHINAEQDPHTVFQSLESRLVARLPKRLPRFHTETAP
ncbi:adenylate kinase 8 [Megalops cyprinoides]|uniref:adenylate kinase 8 n=1 Tax=Megalops cyprinoides TaxID=118141 RepID=UPI001863F67A|nr:adenylate kinase 8 [Megalops cyprinoides]